MFIFNRNTKILSMNAAGPVIHAVEMLERDRDKVFEETEENGGTIILQKAPDGWGQLPKTGSVQGMTDENTAAVQPLDEEQYLLEISDSVITVTASGTLGFVYGLLYLSEHYLDIKPFWFWMDQRIERRARLEIPSGRHVSECPAVRFRGWFFNDEVLMLKWKYNENGVDGWKMCFEALLRCGGNMAIPGTDKMSRKNRALASEMGLWITHHHAEPLGAEMFARAYPDVEPNYMEHKELFHKLWEEAVIQQKDCKVVWNLCFRGQGDAPFWSSDTTGRFDTPEKRGRMISDMIRIQCDLVKKYVENPVFCTNLYGEIMELYEDGYITIDPDIIKVRADNGFGRMVTRRRDNHCVRVSSMPDKNDKSAQGIYYHVSFYDLQAANHITMLPNSISFVDHELSQVLENGGSDFWIINCSNVRPHVYYLDAVRKKWQGRNIDDQIQSREFAADYFGGSEKIAECYRAYQEAMIPYGPNEDDHMGEQYYTENVRIMAHQLLTDPSHNARSLYWTAGEGTFSEQVKRVCGLCRAGLGRLEALYQKCAETETGLLEGLSEEMADHSSVPDISGLGITDSWTLFDATMLLQASIHYFCAKGVVLFGEAYQAYEAGDYKKAFVLFGNSAECFDSADKQMRQAEYGVWKDFYLNDCFADVKHTAYMVRKVMGLVRELGDNVRHDQWYHEFCYTPEDRRVLLLLVLDNHMTDWELYQVMKETL